MTSSTLRSCDWRELHQLAQECRDLGDDALAWREHLSRTLGKLCGAELVCCGDIGLQKKGTIQLLGTVETGWERGFNRTAFIKAITEYGTNLAISPLLQSYIDRDLPAAGHTFSRTELVPDKAWYPTLYYESIGVPVGVDHSLVSFFPQPGRPGLYNGFTLSRECGDRRDFNARDKAMVREIQVMLAPLIGKALALFEEPTPRDLPPRVRQVLQCLLEGDGDKQVAARLKISPYTVNQYVKQIFTHFGVDSRAELLARWVRRGWPIGQWADPVWASQVSRH